MPHGMCFLWNPPVLWLNVISDCLIALAYYAIPFLLFSFTRRRKDLSFNWIFVAFGMFILACGTTHLLGAVTVWVPVYRLDGVIKAVTAIASIATFFLMIPIVPVLVALPSPAALARVNAELEQRVAARTVSLREALANLKTEMQRRQNVEEQLLQAQKMEAVGRLAGGVAHDFNNLLTVIQGYNEMLREQVSSDEQAVDYTSEVQRAADRASALTNQLLAFSRRQMVLPRVVNLNESVAQIEKMLRRIIGEDIRLEIKLGENLAPVNVDPSHIDQVIMNLAVNSRDAMPGGGHLTIETANVELTAEYAGAHHGVTPGPYVMLAVSDSGSGMDAATRARIFEPFFTTKEQGKGTGLGLSIVYGIVKQNQGEILVYSEPGKGTTFKIYFPAVEAVVEASRSVPERVAAGAITGTVLLVEDEEQVRNLTRTMLTRLGYNVIGAGTAAEALRLVREHRDGIDLLLTDIVMPEMSGTTLATQIRSEEPGIRVMFMSGYTDSAVVQQGMLAPETAFIQKPFALGTLAQKLREVLGR